MQAFNLYVRVSGQWNYHPTEGCAVSLKTTEINAELYAMNIEREEWVDHLDAVRELASIILKCWERERERLKEQNGTA